MRVYVQIAHDPLWVWSRGVAYKMYHLNISFQLTHTQYSTSHICQEKSGARLERVVDRENCASVLRRGQASTLIVYEQEV